jgi:hypothetical protein
VKRATIGWVAVVIGALVCGVASAGIWNEFTDGGGDAGNGWQTTAYLTIGQVTNGTGPLTQITGTLPDKSDTDLFKININDPANFMATMNGGTLLDTALYLFDANGNGVVYNNDSSGTWGPGGGNGNQPTIKAGIGSGTETPTGAVTTAGLYWLGVRGYYNGYPWVNYPPTTAMFIATYGNSNWQYGPRNAGALVTWSGGSSGANSVPGYTVTLTGATYATPEPASLGLLSLAALVLRRRQA